MPMYVGEQDEAQSLAVWYFFKCTAAEFVQHFEHLQQVASYSTKTGKRCAALLISRTFDMPDAAVRQRLTQLTGAPGYDPYVAFVAANAVMKTVLGLFAWFQKKPAYTTKHVDDLKSGIRWLEEQRKGPLPRLREMADRVLERAGEPEAVRAAIR